MRKIIPLSLLLILLPTVHAATLWANDPADCPAINNDNFPGQDCSPTNICGDSSGIAQCFNTPTLSPSSNTTSTTDVDSGSFDGGYLINCFVAADASAPFCDNSGSFWCDRNSTIHGTEFRQTICVEGTFGVTAEGDCRSGFYDCYGDTTCESTASSSCENSANNHYVTASCNTDLSGSAAGTCECDAGYFACDGSIIDTDGCEIQAGVSCGSNTGYIIQDQCASGTAGNCTASGARANNRDCDNNDGDSNEFTCNSGNGCEITLFSDTDNPNSVYQTCSTFSCSAGYIDCDGSGDGSDTGNGCEIQESASCGLGTGTYAVAQCQAGTGNCTAVGNNLDCNNDDGDGLLTTCNGADGCEIETGSACTVGSLAGTYNGCTCEVTPSSFTTGNQTNYSTTNPVIWANQYGSGQLLNVTNANTNESLAINNSGCIIFPDGSTQCSNASEAEVVDTSNLVPYTGANQSIDISNQNITTTGTGFFSFLGSLVQRITTIFVQTINVNESLNVTGNFTLNGTTITDFTEIDTDTQKDTNSIYLYNDSTTIYFNETQLNATIDARDGDTTTWANNSGNATYTEGNVGIGTTNPNVTLDVVGNVSISSNLNVSGNIEGTNITIDGKEVCLSDGTNCLNTSNSQSISIGYFVNFTSTSTTGNITNGSLNGYLAANAICDAEYPGSHMCQIHEVLNAINANISLINLTSTFRVSEGAPGFLAAANDCNGWKSEEGSSLGSVWVGDTTTGGSGSLVACNAARPIGCCI